MPLKDDLNKYKLADNLDKYKVGSPPQAQSQGATGLKGFGVGVLKGIGSTVSGLETLGQKGLEAIGNPVVKALTGQKAQSIPTANQAFGKSLEATTTSQKFGKTAEQIGEFFIPGGAVTKVGKAAEGAELLTKAPAALKFGAKLGAEALTSAGLMAGQSAIQEGSTQNVGTNALIGGALPLVSPIIKAVGKGVAEAVIPKSAREAQLLQAYKAAKPFTERIMTALEGTGAKAPVTAGSTAFDKGLMGTESMIGVQAKRASNTLWNDLISPALKSAKEKVNIPQFFKDAEATIRAANPEISRQKDLLNALEAMKSDYKGVKNVTLPQLQKFKEGWAKFVPEKAYRGKPISGAFNDMKDVLADKARTLIYDKLGPEIKQAYFDYGNLKGLQELGQKAMTGQGLKGGFGSFWNTVKDMALVPVGTIGGKVLYKTGQGLEFYGRQGIKTLEELFGTQD